MRYQRIPDETIRRMPMYLRAFSHLKTEHQDTISSRQLAERLRMNPTQIRKDLSYFGAFGTRGVGYPVAETAEQIRGILKLDTPQKAALIGAGRLGTAIAEYPGFSTFGFTIAAVFDNNPDKIGTSIGTIVIEDSAKIGTMKDRGIHLAILAVPAEAAQAVVDQLVDCGTVRGILNLSPCYLAAPPSIKVVTIDLAMALGTLPYYMV